MGKIKRFRQKFHQISKKATQNDVPVGSNDKYEEVEEQLIGKSPLLKSSEELSAIPNDLFAGISINFDDLKKKLDEDDRVSVRSIAKSCKYDSKGKLLTKKEKQKLKHDLFMRKINTVQQLKREALQKHRKRKALKKIISEIQPNPVLSEHSLSSVKASKTSCEFEKSSDTKAETFHKSKVNTKSKPIKKSKARQREMLQEISAFRKILTDPKFVKDPCAVITECVQEKIIGEKSNKK